MTVAVPLGARETCDAIGALADDVVCVRTPEPFYAVGPHYRDFTQTEDDEVIRLLAEARDWSNTETTV